MAGVSPGDTVDLPLDRSFEDSLSLARRSRTFTGENTLSGTVGSSADVGVFSAVTVSTAAKMWKCSTRSRTRG